MKSKVSRIVSVAVCFLGFGTPLMSQAQLAFVDVNRVLSEAAQGKAEAARLNSLITRRTQEITSERDSLNNLQKRLSDGAMTLSQGEISKLQQDIQASNTRIQRMQEDAQAELDLEQEIVLQRLSENLRELLKGVGKERGYGAVFLKSPDRQVFVADALDITTEVIQMYDARFPSN